MLPLGGYKGYGLAIVVEILSAALGGAAVASAVGRLYDDDERPQDVGHFHLAIDPERTVGRARLADAVEALVAELKAITPADDAGEVLVPGSPSCARRRCASATASRSPRRCGTGLAELSARLGVTPPGSRSRAGWC